jgi:hypothetical protein
VLIKYMHEEPDHEEYLHCKDVQFAPLRWCAIWWHLSPITKRKEHCKNKPHFSHTFLFSSRRLSRQVDNFWFFTQNDKMKNNISTILIITQITCTHMNPKNYCIKLFNIVKGIVCVLRVAKGFLRP